MADKYIRTYSEYKTDPEEAGSFLLAEQVTTPVNVDSPILLIGDRTRNYVETFAENTLWHLSNFAYDSEPDGAIEGQLWWDTSSESLKCFNGTDWLMPIDTTAIRNSILTPDDSVYDIGEALSKFKDIWSNQLFTNTTSLVDVNGATKYAVDVQMSYNTTDTGLRMYNTNHGGISITTNASRVVTINNINGSGTGATAAIVFDNDYVQLNYGSNPILLTSTSGISITGYITQSVDQTVPEYALLDQELVTYAYLNQRIIDLVNTLVIDGNVNITVQSISDAQISDYNPLVIGTGISRLKLQDDIIDESKLEDNAVTENKILNQSITYGKCAIRPNESSDGVAPIDYDNIRIGAIRGVVIADLGIEAGKYAEGSIENADIADETIEIGKLAESIKFKLAYGGYVNAAGTTITGSSNITWSINGSHVTGTYTITHDIGATTYAVTATSADDPTETPLLCRVDNVTGTTFRIKVSSTIDTQTLADGGFYFTIIPLD